MKKNLEITGKRIYSLDAVKFVLAVLVVFHHFQQETGTVFAGPNFFGEGTWYEFVVELFFMISGYFAVRGYERIKNTNFKEYYLKKCIRIYPMHLLATGIYCIFWWLYCIVIGSWYSPNMVGLWNAFASLALISHGGVITSVVTAANNPIWYLCVLLICYIALFILCKIAAKFNVAIEYLFVGMILLGVGIQNYLIGIPYFNYYTARGYMSFFLGALMMLFFEKAGENCKKYLKITSASLLGITGAAAVAGVDTVFDNENMILVFIVFPAIMTLFTQSQLIKQIFSSKVWGELGAISFEMYLWHCPFLLIMKFVVKMFGIPVNYGTYGFMIVFTIITILISAILYYVVEKPMMAFLKNKIREEK